jgi:hypothetical protein
MLFGFNFPKGEIKMTTNKIIKQKPIGLLRQLLLTFYRSQKVAFNFR